MVFTPNPCILLCWVTGRLISLFGGLRWFGEGGNIGLAEPLNDGVVGLFALGLSVLNEAIDNRRSHPVDGRRV